MNFDFLPKYRTLKSLNSKKKISLFRGPQVEISQYILMNKTLNTLIKILSGLLLFFNGSSAVFGGMSMILYPDGSSLGLPLNLLEHSPFTDFLVPGIILILSNGLPGLIIFTMLLTGSKRVSMLLRLQGLVLLIWLLVQIAMIRTLDIMQLIMGITAILMLIFSYADLNRKNVN